MFQLREIDQMEREMCHYLEWELNVDPATLKEFEEMVRKDFAALALTQLTSSRQQSRCHHPLRSPSTPPVALVSRLVLLQLRLGADPKSKLRPG